MRRGQGGARKPAPFVEPKHTVPTARPGLREIVEALRGSDLFGRLDDHALERLGGAVEHVAAPAGDVLVRQGDPGDAIYLIVTGRLLATVVGERTELAEMGPGELIGEVAVLRGGQRTATVRALRDSTLLRLSADAFRAVMLDHPDALLSLAAAMADRLAARVDRPYDSRAPVRTLTVVPAGDPPGPRTSGFAGELARALSKLGPTALVGRNELDATLGPGAADRDPGDGEVAAWLQRVEDDHSFLVYEADPVASDWSMRCLRQCDAVVLVADALGNAGLSEVERLASATERPTGRVHLVMLHTPATAAPKGTDLWLGHRTLGPHHHVRDEAGLARVARAIAGRAIGVVLGGGGPRGFAHLGVLRALDEANLTIDAIGGTSMGAILAASAAMGWDIETQIENALDAFVRTRRLLTPTLPWVSLMSARKLTSLLRSDRYFGDRCIEDLWTPFFCVSANITTVDLVVHDRGLVWLALRASSSLPGILPPVHSDAGLLVDGGVMDDLPVDVMRSRSEGPVIAVDLQPQVDLHVHRPFAPDLSGWDVMARRLNPFSPSIDVPGTLAVLMRAKEAGGLRAQREMLARQPADLVLRPPTTLAGSLDFKAGEALIEAGYRYASEALTSDIVEKLTGS